MRILLAENNEINRIFLEDTLKDAGHEVVAVANGPDVLDRLSELPFDQLVLDIHLPELSGVEVTQRIRSGKVLYENTTIPIIAMSGYDYEDERPLYASLGMNTFLPKPIEPGTLLGAIELNEPLVPAPSAQPPCPVLEEVKQQIKRFATRREFLDEMLQLFMARADEATREMTEASRQEDWELLGELAHSLISSAVAIGSDTLVQTARSLQEAARAGDAVQCRDFHQKLEKLISEVTDFLQQEYPDRLKTV